MLVSLDLFNGMENNPMTQYQPYGHPHPGLAPRPPEPRNGMGVASLVLGIVGIALAWVPIVGFLGFLTGILGAIFGPIGISRANKGVATNKGVAIAGLVVSIGAILTSTIVFFSFAAYVADSPSTSSGVRASGPSIPSAQVLPQAPSIATAEVAPAPVQTGPLTTFGDGVYEVGVDIEPGKYKTSGDSGSCYYARLKTGDGSFGDILDNNSVSGPVTVTIKESDGYFESQGCSDWVKAG